MVLSDLFCGTQASGQDSTQCGKGELLGGQQAAREANGLQTAGVKYISFLTGGQLRQGGSHLSQWPVNGKEQTGTIYRRKADGQQVG